MIDVTDDIRNEIKKKLQNVMEEYPPREEEIHNLYEYLLESFPELFEMSKIDPERNGIISGTWWELSDYIEMRLTIEDRLSRDLEDDENRKDAFANILYLIIKLMYIE